MIFEKIKYEETNGIATITFNQPEKLNPFSKIMMEEVVDALNRAEENDQVRVVIVTAKGRAFCVGDDLESGKFEYIDVLSREKKDSEPFRDDGGIIALRLFDMKKPVIAAINGHAVGIGITMTLPMDIRILADSAKLGFVFARRGIVPESCVSWFLPRIIGIGRAIELGVTGRIFTAQDAYQYGLVHVVVPKEDVLPKAIEFANEIIKNTSGVSVALIRQLFWRMLGENHPMEAHKLESKCLLHVAKGPDSEEGVRSFLEKRAPKFTMKTSRDMPSFYPWWINPTFK